MILLEMLRKRYLLKRKRNVMAITGYSSTNYPIDAKYTIIII